MHGARKEAHENIRPHLDADEQLHWSGQPYQGFSFSKDGVSRLVFGLLYLGIAIFWTLKAWEGVPNENSIIFPIFGIPFILVGLYIVVGRYCYDRLRRCYTYYGVTNKRTLIVHGIISQSITSYDIDSPSDITVDENTDGTGTIYFRSSPEQVPQSKPNSNLMQWFSRMFNTPNSFEQIDEAEDVYKTIKKIKEQ